VPDLSDNQLARLAFNLVTTCNPQARRSCSRIRLAGGALFSASLKELPLLGFTPDEMARIARGAEGVARDEWLRCRRASIAIIFNDDPAYPPLLREIHDPPDLLYCLGDPGALQGLHLAVVGARRASPYGHAAIRRLLPAICAAGITIVSGMAYGVDTAAHAAALRAGTPTVGVNAAGLNNLYPAGNRAVIDRIIAQGCVISEFPLDVVSRPFLFPVRNRLIAGIARAVLVIEAARKSGSLITARLAIEGNRDVLAVPGNIDAPLSEGTNYLIAQGARLISTSSDILEEFGIESQKRVVSESELTRGEKRMLDLMGPNELKGIDHFIENLDLSTAEAISTMMGLILKNLVCEEAGLYRRAYYE
jgi:DNA processing protein